MTSAEYLIAGHSHIFAMGAVYSYQGPIDLVKADDGKGYVVMEEWNGSRSSAYWDKLVEASSERDVLIAFNGNQQYGEFLIAPDPLFDFFDEATPELLEGATIVPRRLVQAFFEPSLDELRALVPRIFAAGGRCVRAIGTPPPRSNIHDFAETIRTMASAKSLARLRGIDLERARVTPAPLLLKMWRVVQRLTAEVVSDARFVFVPVPPEALDADGFLAKPFYDAVKYDVTHANKLFGRLMLERTLQTLGS